MPTEEQEDRQHLRRLKWSTAALAVLVGVVYLGMYLVDLWGATS